MISPFSAKTDEKRGNCTKQTFIGDQQGVVYMLTAMGTPRGGSRESVCVFLYLLRTEYQNLLRNFKGLFEG